MIRFHEDTKVRLIELGKKFGFYPVAEKSLPSCRYKGHYIPRHDVVWYAKIKNELLGECLLTAGIAIREGKDTLVPIIIWEITGVDSSTKTIFAELAYSRACGSPFTIIVAPDTPYDKGKGSRGMNISRASKIVETYQKFQPGHRVAATSHSNIVKALNMCSTENKLIVINVKREYTPLAYKLLGRTKHNIRTDIAITVTLDRGISSCLKKYFYIPWPTIEIMSEIEVLGIEYERRTGQKHLAGSIFYLLTMYPYGLIITKRKEEARKLLVGLGGGVRVKILDDDLLGNECGNNYMLVS